jgi:hypothetical protein
MKFSMITLLVFLSIGFKGFAKCGGSNLSVFPEKREIKKTSLFLLEGYAGSQLTIESLNTKFPIYLKSGDEKISLMVIETNKGLFQLTQALLKPEKPLTPGKEYQLIIDSLPKHEHLDRYNERTDEYEPIIYLALDEEDTAMPEWNTVVKEKGKSMQQYGCGPAVHVTFHFNASDESELWVKTILKSVETGRETTYILISDKKDVSIGHEMCSGAFTFREGKDYQVQFSLLDSSGNVSDKVSDWIAFTRPVD